MDELDKRLIAALQENSRASATELGRRFSLSRTTVQSRIDRLQRSGIIAGYGVRLAPGHDPGAIRAHILIKLVPKAAAGVEAAVRRMPEVRVLHSVSGDYDMIAIAGAADVGAIDTLIDKIGALAGVERTTSSIVLSTKFDRQGPL
jgi:DNA-binding Lrp family transcriptional regulator